MAELSAQRVRSKARNAVRRREDQIEQEEVESGELNLIPYLDIVTNLVLFLLASITAGLILVQIDTVLPDKAPKSNKPPQNPPADPNDQPLKMVISVERGRVVIWSFSQLEGTLQNPKAVFQRTGRDGDSCDGPYMCESNSCSDANKCVPSKDPTQWVYDWRGINNVLVEIVTRRYAPPGQPPHPRKADTYQILLQADPSTPYSTIVSMMSAMRCKLVDFGKEPTSCALPTEDPGLKKDPNPISGDGKLYDTSRANYDPNKMALFSDIGFSTGFE